MSSLILDNEEKRRAVIEGIASGLSLDDVALKLGLNKTTIHNYRCSNEEFDKAVVQASQSGGRIGYLFVYQETPPHKDRPLQARIIDDILKGGSCTKSALAQIVEKHGLKLHQIWLWRRLDDEWLVKLEAALLKVRNPNLNHGTSGAHKHGCRCIHCRAIKTGGPAAQKIFISKWQELVKTYGKED